MEYPPTPQQDPQFMAEAAEAAARINAQSRFNGGQVYGSGNVYNNAPSLEEARNVTAEQLGPRVLSDKIGNVAGAAVVEGANAYVDESQRGVIAARVAAQNAERLGMYDQFLRDLNKDDEKEKADA